MVISGVVYSVGDWIAQVSFWYIWKQIFRNISFGLNIFTLIYNVTLLRFWNLQCYEGKPLFEFDRARMFRSGLVGFTLHGSLSHYYYQFCEVIISFTFLPSLNLLWLMFYIHHLTNLSPLLCRHFSLSMTGGWFRPKSPLTKLHGQLYGTAFIIQFWDSCDLNPQLVFLPNWRQHFSPC